MDKASVELLRKLSYDAKLSGEEAAALRILLDRYVKLEKRHQEIANLLSAIDF